MLQSLVNSKQLSRVRIMRILVLLQVFVLFFFASAYGQTVRIFGEHTNFESNLRWDPNVLFSGSKLLCVLLHEKKKNKHLFTQIHGDLNEIIAFKVGTISMNNG